MRIVKAVLLIALGFALARWLDRRRNRRGNPPVLEVMP